MAKKATNTAASRQRNGTKGNNLIGIVIAVIVVVLVLIFAFSRNTNKDRVGARTPKELPAPTSSPAPASEQHSAPKVNSSAPRTVKMRKDESELYYIPVRINGQELEFIFDTGCSGVSLSLVEAQLLMKQGKLTEDDVLRESYMTIADGSQVPVYIVNLRSVEVAGVVLHDVEASISISQEAPILLGQSVMARFGSFTMDYDKSTVTFR